MNYEKIYHSIISKAKDRGLNKKKLKGYYEKHHIIPSSLGGDDCKSNLVLLTSREHFIAHACLWRFTTGADKTKMLYAFNAMRLPKNNNERYFNSRLFEKAKAEFVLIQSERLLGKRMIPDDFKHKEESKSKISKSLKLNNSKLTKSERSDLYGVCQDWQRTPERRKIASDANIKRAENLSLSYQKYYYVIEGKRYNSIATASKEIGLNKSTISSRCKSESDRFSLWLIYEINNG